MAQKLVDEWYEAEARRPGVDIDLVPLLAAALDARYAQAIEDAARVADKQAQAGYESKQARACARYLAAAIRALTGSAQPGRMSDT